MTEKNRKARTFYFSQLISSYVHNLLCISSLYITKFFSSNACKVCHGTGWLDCQTCNGMGQLKYFIKIDISFLTETDEYVHESTDLPSALTSELTASTIFEEVSPRIGPIQNYYIKEINANSSLLVSKHGSQWPNDRINQQRHSLESIPVFEVHYKSKKRPSGGRFWVYGKDKLIHTDDEPNCCNDICTLL